MEVRAVSKYVRISPQKVRKVVGDIKGIPVESGLQKLKFMPQKAANILEKIIRSAVANADQNADIDIDMLVIRNITAEPQALESKSQGPGNAYIKKNQSHYCYFS